MSRRIIDRLTPEGQRLQQVLKELSVLEVRIGYQQGDVDENGVDMCDIAAWNELGTVRSPSRPFLRKSVDENKEKINMFLEEQVQAILSGVSAEQVLKDIGMFQKDLVQAKIIEGEFEPNSQATIRKKGSDKPLIDTGRMSQSVNFVIKKKGSDR